MSLNSGAMNMVLLFVETVGGDAISGWWRDGERSMSRQQSWHRWITGIGERGSTDSQWILAWPQRHTFPCHGELLLSYKPLCRSGIFLVVLLGWDSQKSGVGEAPLLGRVANHRSKTMLQSRIRQKEVIRWGVMYHLRTELKNLIGFASLAVKWTWWAGAVFWRRAA